MDHVADAIRHTKEAIAEGKKGHAKELVTPADLAKQHAMEAEKVEPSEHVKQALAHLDAALAEGRKDDAAAATKHAEQALEHLEMAEKK
jgi:hypothetical protein